MLQSSTGQKERKALKVMWLDLNVHTENRIEDEEWDKYIIPSKVESEKYKVSRTFSFLKNRMSSTRNKTKVRPNNGAGPVENIIAAAGEFT